MGAQRTNDMRRRLAEMIQRQGQQRQAPRFAGGFSRKSVAGPGVRQFSGRGPLQPSALDSLTSRFGGGTVPFGRAVPGLPSGGLPGLPEQLSDPAVGPTTPQNFSPRIDNLDRLVGSRSQVSEQPVSAGVDLGALAGGGAVGGLIPLGGGAYFDPASGMLYGAGGVKGF